MRYTLEDLFELKRKITYYDYEVNKELVLDLINSAESMVKQAIDEFESEHDGALDEEYDRGYSEGYKEGAAEMKKSIERMPLPKV